MTAEDAISEEVTFNLTPGSKREYRSHGGQRVRAYPGQVLGVLEEDRGYPILRPLGAGKL